MSGVEGSAPLAKRASNAVVEPASYPCIEFFLAKMLFFTIPFTTKLNSIDVSLASALDFRARRMKAGQDRVHFLEKGIR